MLTHVANGDSRLSFWSRVRRYAVPPSMIETATARREVGDWAGACAAAGIDIDLQPRTVALRHGQDVAARLRADLRHLAPDLLRWHLPRIAPDGLLRPGLTITLARYGAEGRAGPYPVHLVVRTPPAWADAGQRIGLALWDGSAGPHSVPDTCRHPHPRPSRRYRLDLHRHLWDARRASELRPRSGAADQATADGPVLAGGEASGLAGGEASGAVPPEYGCAVGRWADEARIVLAAEGRSGGPVLVRLGARRRLLLHLDDGPDGAGSPALRIEVASDGDVAALPLPVLPDAATWVPPDLELLRSGAIDADRLHPLVASALVPGHVPVGPHRAADPAGEPRVVECRGEQHRIGLVDGVVAPLDHDPDEIRREELLVALTGTPLPCLQAIDRAHRRPDGLSGVRERLDHGDTAGALAVVEGLLGPEAVLRDGPLRDELEAAARRRITYGLYRSGLMGTSPERIRLDDRRRPTRARRSRDALFY
ncbi:hypothetical protein [Streptomyces ossamyceticus]|uniref:hypothetical protein n=1 Tax=Streptomyces ossamyceticus TaxID=249581 RepID=UPI00099E87DF|nr:hypothetical protein [Streptomyces ossamyceticus]